MKGSDGKTKELLTPSKLAEFLGKIPACPGEDCNILGKCCHINIVIESCYAGNFKVIAGHGRTVMGSSDDEPAAAGAFTPGFVEASRDENSDTDDDGDVDFGEAYEGAKGRVEEKNKEYGRDQEPWKIDQECDCVCPCYPNISVDKLVWDGIGWVDEVSAEIGQTVRFACEVKNDGKCRNVTEIEINDLLVGALNYVEGSSILYRNGEEVELEPIVSDHQLTWNLGEITLSPGETLRIEFEVETTEINESINSVEARARCTYDPSLTVEDQDKVVVNIIDRTPPTTEKEVGKPSSPDGYNVTLVTPIWLNATDESGVAYIYYEIWCDLNGNGSIDSDEMVGNETVVGTNTTIYLRDYLGARWDVLVELRWYAVDKSGNRENTHYQKHYVRPL